MALRTRDRADLASAIAAFVAVAEQCSGPLRAIQQRWLEALVAEDGTALPALRAAADAFEAIGYLLPAADCHADAALIGGRAGIDPAFDLAEARRLYAACGAEPLLGRLPEVASIGAAGAADGADPG